MLQSGWNGYTLFKNEMELKINYLNYYLYI